VAHPCNPSYAGGKDQEDLGSNPAQAIVHETLSQKSPSQKRAGGVAQGGPEFKPQNHQKKKERKKVWRRRGENFSVLEDPNLDPKNKDGIIK
jgi:hypothetical protein